MEDFELTQNFVNVMETHTNCWSFVILFHFLMIRFCFISFNPLKQLTRSKQFGVPVHSCGDVGTYLHFMGLVPKIRVSRHPKSVKSSNRPLFKFIFYYNSE